MHQYFSPEGLLSKRLKQFEFRSSQLEMAQAVYECLREGRTLLVEAGTGTGKTWAYLVPALLSGKKVVISTGTKTLQDQILDHDVPVLRRLLFPRLQVVCLKGRKNYLCRRRFRDFSYQPTLYNKAEAILFRRFQKWADRTSTGDRAEIEWLPDRFYTWNEVSSSADQCLGQLCEDHSRCFLNRHRSDASRAHLIIVNHHLFFADLALRSRRLGEVIPDYDAVVLDEAHQLEDIAGLYFGIGLGSTSLHDLMRDILREIKKNRSKELYPSGVQQATQQLDVLGRLLHHHLQKSCGSQGRFPLKLENVGDGFSQTCRQLIHTLEQLSALLSPSADRDALADSFCRRCSELAHGVTQILEQRDPSMVYWYEVTPQAVFIHGTPVEVGSILRGQLFESKPAAILTSATLSVAGSMDYLKRTLGTREEAKELLLPSPYAFDRQAVLYVPLHLPSPDAPLFCAQIADEAHAILSQTQGRALFLFTSYRNLNDVHQRLKDRIPYPLLVQGQKPKRVLLAEFRDNIHSVLLATSSFWQGVDVPGEALTCLLIDKLPFEVPDDPIIAARMGHLAQKGKSPFFDYQVPRAIIHLKQGVGRLIRSSTDRGLIVLFDVRLFTKKYGQLFVKSLPPCRIVHKMEEIDISFFPPAGVSPGMLSETF